MNTIDSCVVDVFIYNCQLSILNQVTILKNKLLNALKIMFLNTNLNETTLVTVFEVFMYHNIQISIFDDTFISSDETINHFEDVFHSNAQVSFLVSMKNFVYGCNVTKHQLRLLFKFSNKQYCNIDIVDIIKHQGMFLLYNQHLRIAYFTIKANATTDITRIFTALNDVSTLKIFGIDGCAISKEDAYKLKDIIFRNNDLQGLYLNICFQAAEPCRTILKALSDISTFCVHYKNVLGIKCSKDVQVTISQTYVSNIHLQIAGTIEIDYECMPSVPYLEELKCSGININKESAIDLATVFFQSSKIQVCNL